MFGSGVLGAVSSQGAIQEAQRSKGIKHVVAASIVAVGMMANVASAFTPPPEEGSGTIVICYYAKSIVAGLSKCDPPSTLMASVFGACNEVEEQIRQDIFNRPSDGTDPREVADIAIRHIHERLGPRVQGWILDAQISSNAACKK